MNEEIVIPLSLSVNLPYQQYSHFFVERPFMINFKANCFYA